MDFQSPDDIDTTKVLKRTVQKSPSARAPHVSQRSPALSSNQSHSKSTIKAYFQPIPKQNNNTHLTTSAASGLATTKSAAGIGSAVKKEKPDVIIDAEKELDMLLSPEKYLSDDENGMRLDNNNDDIESDEEDFDDELTIDTTMRKSAYMSEKSSKKKIYKDGEIVMSRPQRKDKGKPRFTAYMLWSKEIRQEMLKSNPNMDFSQASRRLSSMWSIVPNNEKNIWRRRAKRVTIKNKRALKTGDKLTTKYLNRTGQKKPGRKPKHMKDNNTSQQATTASAAASASPTKKTKSERKSHASSSSIAKHIAKDNESSKHKNTANNNTNLSNILPGSYKVTGTSPSDVAAHLKLLGDNLTIIGQRLKEHEVIIKFVITLFASLTLAFVEIFFFRYNFINFSALCEFRKNNVCNLEKKITILMIFV